MKTENDEHIQCQQPPPAETLRDSRSQEKHFDERKICSLFVKQVADLKAEAEQENEDGETFECHSHCVKLSRETEVGKSQYVCQDCGIGFSRRSHLKSHVQRRHSVEKKYKCKEYGTSSLNSSSLSNHKLTHTGENEIRCLYCSSSFTTRNALIIHIRTHTYECHACGVTFSQRGSLKSHIQRRHIGEKNFKCGDCGAAFAHADDLKKHAVIHAGEKKYKCEECGKSFSQSPGLWAHKLTHTGEKKFKCHYCNKGFSRKCDVKMHIRIHTGEKPLKCQDCGAAFAQREILRRHIQRIHSGEKNYKCNECGVALAHADYLRKHKLIHSGEKRFRCQCCDAAFLRKGELKTHIRIHTGEKPYKCRHCPATFPQSSALKWHSRIHIKENNYKCEECGVTYSDGDSLKRHLQIHNLSESVRSSCADAKTKTDAKNEVVFCSPDTSITAKSVLRCHKVDSNENSDSLFEVKDESRGDVKTGIDSEKESVESIADNFKVEVPVDDCFGRCYVTLADSNINMAGELEDIDKKQGRCNLNVSSSENLIITEKIEYFLRKACYSVT